MGASERLRRTRKYLHKSGVRADGRQLFAGLKMLSSQLATDKSDSRAYVYSELRTCPTCGVEFTVLLEHWAGKYRVKVGTAKQWQKYCTKRCQWTAANRRNIGRKR